MKHLCAALLLLFTIGRADFVFAKETCAHTWGKGDYKTFKEVESELQGRLGGGKIIRLSLCGGANNHYFQVTVLEPTGKVLVLTLAAR